MVQKKPKTSRNDPNPRAIYAAGAARFEWTYAMSRLASGDSVYPDVARRLWVPVRANRL